MNCPPFISFGLDVREPSKLGTRNTGQVLQGICAGEWQEAVSRVRSLPSGSKDQHDAKVALPYCTWAGVFSRRANSGLVRHSGQCGVDLDGLGEGRATAALQTAVADRFCLAAFRSARGEGVRLIIKIPPCSPENHDTAFGEVAEHVRTTYGCEPDTSGRDVSRASFVSFDRGLWVNYAAEVLPIHLPDETQRVSPLNRCVSSPLYSGMLAEVWPTWYGRHLANVSRREDGTAKTHDSLLNLGKSLALHANKIKTPLTVRLVDAALDAWLAEHARQGVRLRCAPDDYRAELLASVRGAERKPWFKLAAEKWLRWTRHKEFPRFAPAHEKILFAVQRHCDESNTSEFFIGSRDAGLIAGVSYITASRMLRKLCADGHLEKTGKQRQPRHAQTYRLKT